MSTSLMALGCIFNSSEHEGSLSWISLKTLRFGFVSWRLDRTDENRLGGKGQRMLLVESFLTSLPFEFRLCRIIPSVIKWNTLAQNKVLKQYDCTHFTWYTYPVLELSTWVIHSLAEGLSASNNFWVPFSRTGWRTHTSSKNICTLAFKLLTKFILHQKFDTYEFIHQE